MGSRAIRWTLPTTRRPGFGYSERGPGDWSPARQAAQLRSAVRKLGVQRPIVVGHSWGAAVALAWALDTPDEVSGVVSVSGATMPWGWAVDVLDVLGVGRLGATVYEARLRSQAESGGVEAFVGRVFRPQAPPSGYIDFVGAPLALRPDTMTANSDDLAGLQTYLSDLSSRYPGLRVPVEIVHGNQDWLLDVERHAVGLAERLPKARLSIAEGVDHMAHHARPDLLARAIDRIGALATA